MTSKDKFCFKLNMQILHIHFTWDLLLTYNLVTNFCFVLELRHEKTSFQLLSDLFSTNIEIKTIQIMNG